MMIPYLIAGFMFFLRSIRIVRGTGKTQIHPKTHSQVLLFLGALLSLSACHVQPQSLHTPTVERTTAVPRLPFTSPCFSRLKVMCVLPHLGQPALLSCSCSLRISVEIAEPQNSQNLELFLISAPQFGHFIFSLPFISWNKKARSRSYAPKNA